MFPNYSSVPPGGYWPNTSGSLSTNTSPWMNNQLNNGGPNLTFSTRNSIRQQQPFLPSFQPMLYGSQSTYPQSCLQSFMPSMDPILRQTTLPNMSTTQLSQLLGKSVTKSTVSSSFYPTYANMPNQFTIASDGPGVAPQRPISTVNTELNNAHVLGDRNVSSMTKEAHKDRATNKVIKVNHQAALPEDDIFSCEEVSPGRTSRPASLKDGDAVVVSPFRQPPQRLMTSPTRRRNNRIKGDLVAQRVDDIETVLEKRGIGSQQSFLK